MLSHKKLIPKGVRGIPVNDEKYLEMGEKSIPVDEKFFYRYAARFILSFVIVISLMIILYIFSITRCNTCQLFSFLF